jgi:hypothetical protein
VKASKPLSYDGREFEGWRAIAAVLTRVLDSSVCVKSAMRYHSPEDPEALRLPVGQRGNRTRFLRLDAEVEGWVAWWKGQAGERRRALLGDRRRAQVGASAAVLSGTSAVP